MKNPEIYPNLIHLSNDHYRLDIQMENIPPRFLGTAFHIHIKGSNWVYEGYKLGSLFDKPNTIALATQKDLPEKTLIFGVTLKKGSVVKDLKGTLVSFNLKFSQAPKIEITFNNNLVSILEKDRKNIDSVSWHNKTFDLSALKNSEIITKENNISKKIKSKETPESITDTTTEEITNKVETQTEEQEIPKDTMILEQNEYHHFFWPVFLIIITLLSIGIFFLIKHFKQIPDKIKKEKIDLK